MLLQPLAGVRVVDFGLLLPGPYASRLLADLGADVIAVRPPGGDPGQEILPGLFGQLHEGKQAVELDLKTPDGLAAATRLISSADVVIEGFRPGVADRLGIGFDAAAVANPRVVYCSISGYGQSGPRRTAAAHDGNIEANGGAFAGAVAIGEDPVTPYLPIADLGAASLAAVSILSGLLSDALQTRQGAVHLDVSMEDVMVHLATPRWGRFLEDGTDPRVEDLIAYSAGAGVFRTSDGRHVALAAIETPFWRGLCDVLGMPELAAPPYDGLTSRSVGRAALRARVASAVSSRESHSLLQELTEAGVPASLVRTVSEVVEDPHLSERGLFRRDGDRTRVAHPVRWGAERPGSASDGVPEPGSNAWPLSRFTRVDGLRLHHLEWNPEAGRPVLLIHGINVQAHTWDPIADDLARDRRVIAVDLRGHGDSDWAASGYALDGFVRDIVGTLRRLGVERCDVVGHSLGGRAALALSAEHPEMVETLVLSDTGPEIAIGGSVFSRNIVASTGDVRGFRSTDEARAHYERLHPEWQPVFLDLHAEHQVRRNWAGKLVFKSDPELFWVTGSAGRRENDYLWSVLPQIDAPTLIMWGTRSEFLDDEIADRMTSSLPHSEIVRIDAGHYIPREKPAEFTDAVRRFFDSHVRSL